MGPSEEVGLDLPEARPDQPATATDTEALDQDIDSLAAR